MKRLFAVVLALVTLSFAQPEQVKKAHATTHEIEMHTLDNGSGCSATAVLGHHALLTASHCEQPTDSILIDGNDAKIIKIIRDGLDHSILLVDATFADYAEFSERELEQGDSVFMFGNPGTLSDIMRFGIFAGVKPPSFFGNHVPMQLFDMNLFHGDSGAAYFDAVTGKVAAVVSGVYIQVAGENDTMKIEYTYPLNFTKEQLDEARKF